jgi:hypothetical protein
MTLLQELLRNFAVMLGGASGERREAQLFKS